MVGDAELIPGVANVRRTACCRNLDAKAAWRRRCLRPRGRFARRPRRRPARGLRNPLRYCV